MRARVGGVALAVALLATGCASPSATSQSSTSTQTGTSTAAAAPRDVEQGANNYNSHRRHHHRRSGRGQGNAVASPRPSGGTTPFPCDDNQFLTDQTGFANGSISGDQFVDVCGPVTQILGEKTTRSGTHGYFFVRLPSGYQIEIVSNLDAMAQAPTNQPPPWPWVAVNDYVYVQGRYYYDNSSSQGIDWTEDDTSRSWPHVGYVAVCDSAGANCSKYW